MASPMAWAPKVKPMRSAKAAISGTGSMSGPVPLLERGEHLVHGRPSSAPDEGLVEGQVPVDLRLGQHVRQAQGRLGAGEEQHVVGAAGAAGDTRGGGPAQASRMVTAGQCPPPRARRPAGARAGASTHEAPGSSPALVER